MDIKGAVMILLFVTAYTATVAIPLARGSGLSVPIWAVIGFPSAFPHGRFFAAEVTRAKGIQASVAAKTMCVLDFGCGALNRLRTVGAIDDYSVALKQAAALDAAIVGVMTSGFRLLDMTRVTKSVFATNTTRYPDKLFFLRSYLATLSTIGIFVCFQVSGLAKHFFAAMGAWDHGTGFPGLSLAFPATESRTISPIRSAFICFAAIFTGFINFCHKKASYPWLTGCVSKAYGKRIGGKVNNSRLLASGQQIYAFDRCNYSTVQV